MIKTLSEKTTSTETRKYGFIQKYIVPYKKRLLLAGGFIALSAVGIGTYAFAARYSAKPTEIIVFKELTNAEYPENPAPLSKQFKRYSDRQLTLIQRDATHFDFVLASPDATVAKITLKNIDVSLMTPKLPDWTKGDPGLEVIALTDREWNRQQVTFPANSPQVEITGGDGFEKKELQEIAIANNCLNAGYWEILLFNKEDTKKTMYYQGWFTFPMGHYKNLFEANNQISYWQNWWRLEHWQDPAGTTVNLNELRKITREQKAVATFSPEEPIIAGGEQARKVRTTLTPNLKTWQDFYSGAHNIQFATFQPPGYYNADAPWNHEYWRMGKFDAATLREIQPISAKHQSMQELELAFTDTRNNEQNKLIISGFNLKDIPQLPTNKYGDGFYMPLGIGVPPFFQSYEKLAKTPPSQTPYFGVLVDSKNRWIDHHKLALDGVVMYRDQKDSKLLHVNLLSYERNTLINHIKIQLE